MVHERLRTGLNNWTWCLPLEDCCSIEKKGFLKAHGVCNTEQDIEVCELKKQFKACAEMKLLAQ